MSRLLARMGVAAAAFAACAALAGELKHDVGTNDSPLYEKECGGCHFAYQPGWLPERSWRLLMGSLSSHFGENAEIAPGTREAITAYLAGRAADRARSSRPSARRKRRSASRRCFTSVASTAASSIRISAARRRRRPWRNARSATRGRTAAGSAVTYTVSDERFRTDDVDMSASLPVPEWMRMGK